ncbi:DUF5053 domain-containing protein [Bacteroides intestinalis]|uniref:DUF5053 domain-containing protein n=1 Tax=Bacteroides intestinalis TaxID=329854 RepID=UPI00189EEDE9|nr:DUF5053 domain-containing protein [Bacteroides intestinalis]
MNMQEELNRWKNSFKAARTPEEKAEHKKQFQAFLKTLSPAEGKEFAQAFYAGAKDAKERYESASQALELKKDLEEINDFTSMSYIAKHYFGKTRHWLYQRINGSIVNGKPVSLNDEEKRKLVAALKELGTLMNRTALTIEQSLKIE